MALEVLGFVPARGGSKRVPDKNLAELGGRSLVRRALETANAAKRVAVTALSSDDRRILDEGGGVEGVLVIPRPRQLSRPDSTSHSAAVHALAESERRLGRRFDAVALVQCTSPFTLPEDIDGAIELLDRTGAGSVFSVCRLDHAYHPAKVRILDGDRLLPYEGDAEPRPAHELSTLWVNNGSIYLSRRETLEQGSLASADLCGYRMPDERSLDVNTVRDLEFARFLEERAGVTLAR
jgi:CMP-N-acetylneuraminic acid synthetase